MNSLIQLGAVRFTILVRNQSRLEDTCRNVEGNKGKSPSFRAYNKKKAVFGLLLNPSTDKRSQARIFVTQPLLDHRSKMAS